MTIRAWEDETGGLLGVPGLVYRVRLCSKQIRSCRRCLAETHLTPCNVSTWHRVCVCVGGFTAMEVLAVWFLQQQLVGHSPSSLMGVCWSSEFHGLWCSFGPWLCPGSCSPRPAHCQVGLSLYCTLVSAAVQYRALCGFRFSQGAKVFPCRYTSSQPCLPLLGWAVSDHDSQNFSPALYPTPICPDDQ